MAENQEGSNKANSSTIKVLVLAVAISIVLSAGIAGGLIYVLGGDDKQEAAADGEGGEDSAEASTEPPIYHSMDPKFVVSFRDQKKARFMQFSLEVMARDRDVIESIKQHSPAVRSNLLMLIDSQDSETMNTREGKEQLLVDITSNINDTLKKIGSEAGVEAAYYNSFVIQ